MRDARFDIRFSGQLVPGTDPITARERLQALFKLSDSAAARLFSGTPVTIKRDIDSEMVARYRERFQAAGALIEAVPSDNAEEKPAHPSESGATAEASTPTASTGPADKTSPDTAGLSLAPPGGWLQEEPDAPPPPVDIAHLSLVPGDDWTLEDCSPAPSPARLPDIGHLRLEPITPRQEEPADA